MFNDKDEGTVSQRAMDIEELVNDYTENNENQSINVK